MLLYPFLTFKMAFDRSFAILLIIFFLYLNSGWKTLKLVLLVIH